jgi:hypothetical protein
MFTASSPDRSSCSRSRSYYLSRMTAVLVIEDDGVIARAMGAHLRNSG